MRGLQRSVVLIEDKASGTQLIQELIDYGVHAVTRYQPQSDKIMRSQRCHRQRLSRQAKLCFAESMHAQTAIIENGFVHLPKQAA
jgi:phage terminase large subunit-like protein